MLGAKKKQLPLYTRRRNAMHSCLDLQSAVLQVIVDLNTAIHNYIFNGLVVHWRKVINMESSTEHSKSIPMKIPVLHRYF